MCSERGESQGSTMSQIYPLFFPLLKCVMLTHTEQSCACTEMCENHLKCVKCGPFESMPSTHMVWGQMDL